jgi:rare lipoprotein A
MDRKFLVALVVVWLLTGISQAQANDKTFSGTAHWYGPGFHGKRAANGKRFDKNLMTAAHTKLPFGTMVRVTHRKSGKTQVVEINDRCAPMRHRVIDLSEGAAKALGIYPSGTAIVQCDIIH